METAGTKPNRNATKNNNTQMAKQLNTYLVAYLNLSTIHPTVKTVGFLVDFVVKPKKGL
jgi:hypothetical protein